MPNEKQPSESSLKVTDKRIFTAEGDLRDEFKQTINPADPQAVREQPAAPQPQPPQPKPAVATEAPESKKKKVRDAGANPGTSFTNFIESLIIQVYMSLGMLRSPYQPAPPETDFEGARQMIDILVMLEEKTRGNLSEDEEAFLAKHLAECKLAYVQKSKAI